MSTAKKMKIGLLVGSLRRESFNRKTAKHLIETGSPLLEMELIEIGDLSFFNQDLEANPPEAWLNFRKKIEALDGFILVTPEYNRSITAVLKNALDIASRPYGKNLWDSKPCAIISVSVGAMGGFGANHHLRQSMVFLNCPCMQQPEVYLANADKLFDEKGQLTNDDTKAFLAKFLKSYENWVKIHSSNKE